MGFPLLRVVGLLIRLTSRPLSSFLVFTLKHQKVAYRQFEKWGHKANEFEAYITFRTTNPDYVSRPTKEQLNVAVISREQAFHKGIDYFVELLVFYGIVTFFSVYEFRKQ